MAAEVRLDSEVDRTEGSLPLVVVLSGPARLGHRVYPAALQSARLPDSDNPERRSLFPRWAAAPALIRSAGIRVGGWLPVLAGKPTHG